MSSVRATVHTQVSKCLSFQGCENLHPSTLQKHQTFPINVSKSIKKFWFGFYNGDLFLDVNKSHDQHFRWVKMQLSDGAIPTKSAIIRAIQHSSEHPILINFPVILVATHISPFLSNTWKYNFLIDHHYKTVSETLDRVAFVGIVWCSCRVPSLQGTNAHTQVSKDAGASACVLLSRAQVFMSKYPGCKHKCPNVQGCR